MAAGDLVQRDAGCDLDASLDPDRTGDVFIARCRSLWVELTAPEAVIADLIA